MNGLPPNRRLRALALSLQRIKNERCPLLSAASQPAAGWDRKTCSKTIAECSVQGIIIK